MFQKYNINYQTNLFDELSRQTQFEFIGHGRNRKGAVLVDCKNDLIPLVRTTTNYKNPAQLFSKLHNNIIENIKKITENNKLQFNNALIEIYDSRYYTMGEHSDQALDLAKNSCIAIFSCYNDPMTTNVRKLKIKEKEKDNYSEISLSHNSIVLFSLETNSNHLHKIVLDNINNNDTKWLGITFRLSKTFIKFVNEIPYFYPTDIELRLAKKNEAHEFYKLRSLENKLTHFEYPKSDYTVSISDLMQIK